MIPRGLRQQGFVLALTLWILAIIAIVAGYFAERLARDMELARQAQQNVQALVGMADTRAEILFRLGTQPMSLYGLGHGPDDSVALDNRPYRGSGGSVVRLQDNRGLYNLNILMSEERLGRLLGVLGVPAESQAAMIDTLLDYEDEDDLRRLNGAEKKEYEALGLPPPRNDRLVTPYEARRVLGWGKVEPLWQNDRLASLVTTSTSVALNPNTAPWEVLASLPGVTSEVAHEIIARRRVQPLTSVDQIAALIGVPPQQLLLQIITLPSDSLRVTQSAPGVPWSMQYSVSLTPNADWGPWRIDYFYKTRLISTDEDLAKYPELPKASTLPLPTLPPFLSAQ